MKSIIVAPTASPAMTMRSIIAASPASPTVDDDDDDDDDNGDDDDDEGYEEDDGDHPRHHNYHRNILCMSSGAWITIIVASLESPLEPSDALA